MANLPTPNKSLSKSSDKPSDVSQAGSLAVKFIVRSAFFGVSAIAGIGIGLAIAVLRPDIVWQPSSNNFLNYKKQQFTISADALFEVNKATIRTESFRLLDEIAAQLPLAAGKKVRINGHMDVSGAGNELTLSYLRASAVKEYLARLRGEQTYYWMVVGYGASRPLASSVADSNGKSNRRIEIFVDD